MEWFDKKVRSFRASRIMYNDFLDSSPGNSATKSYTSRRNIRCCRSTAPICHSSRHVIEGDDAFCEDENVAVRIHVVRTRICRQYLLRNRFLLGTEAEIFADLETISSMVRASYQEPYQKFGLFRNDEESKRGFATGSSPLFSRSLKILHGIFLAFNRRFLKTSIWSQGYVYCCSLRLIQKLTEAG